MTTSQDGDLTGVWQFLRLVLLRDHGLKTDNAKFTAQHFANEYKGTIEEAAELQRIPFSRHLLNFDNEMTIEVPAALKLLDCDFCDPGPHDAPISHFVKLKPVQFADMGTQWTVWLGHNAPANAVYYSISVRSRPFTPSIAPQAP